MNKDFIVRSSKTGEELTIAGKTLADALQKEGLNPSIWLPAEDTPKSSEANFGEVD